jgi:hypothetical protein
MIGPLFELDFFAAGTGDGVMLDVDVGMGVGSDEVVGDEVYEVMDSELLSVVVDSIVEDSNSREDRKR